MAADGRFVAYALRTGCPLSSEMLEYLQTHQVPVVVKYVDFTHHVRAVPALHDHANGQFLSVEDTVNRIKALASGDGKSACTLYVHPDSPTSNKLLEYIIATSIEIDVEDVSYLDYVRTVPALEDTREQLLYIERGAIDACASLHAAGAFCAEGMAASDEDATVPDTGAAPPDGNAKTHDMLAARGCDGDSCPIDGGPEYRSGDLAYADPVEVASAASTDVGALEGPAGPSRGPTDEPGKSPTDEPGKSPTDESGKSPTDEPGKSPTDEPGKSPTDEPGKSPTDEPGNGPSAGLGHQSSTHAHEVLATAPWSGDAVDSQADGARAAAGVRDASAGAQPNAQPNAQPIAQPNAQPIAQPNVRPAEPPDAQPTEQPDAQPTEQPDEQPDAHATARRQRRAASPSRRLMRSSALARPAAAQAPVVPLTVSTTRRGTGQRARTDPRALGDRRDAVVPATQTVHV